MATPNTFNDDTLLRKALYDLLANDTTLFNLISEATLNASEWLVSSWTPSYVATNKFTLPGDHTEAYVVGRRVRAHLSSGYVYSHVTESSFSAVTGDTSITLNDSVLNSSIDEAALGIISPSPTTSIPVENLELVAPIPLNNWQTDPDEHTVFSQDAYDSDGMGKDLLYKYVFAPSVFSAMFTHILVPFGGYDLDLTIPYRMSSSAAGAVAWRVYYRVLHMGESYSEITNWSEWAAVDDAVLAKLHTPPVTANQRGGTSLVIPSSAYSAYDTIQIGLARNGALAEDTHPGYAEVDDAIILAPVT